jgi:predicted nuclease of predicted toxin-antitoxin system
VVLLRHITELSRAQQAALLVANLPTVIEDLDEGAIVSLSPTRLAVRSLPLG